MNPDEDRYPRNTLKAINTHLEEARALYAALELYRLAEETPPAELRDMFEYRLNLATSRINLVVYPPPF